jgi:hypothetical protein
MLGRNRQAASLYWSPYDQVPANDVCLLHMRTEENQETGSLWEKKKFRAISVVNDSQVVC